MTTKEQQLKDDTLRHFTRESEAAAELWEWIRTNTQPDEASEEAVFFPGGYFDVIKWINYECLEANSHDLLLATGGPAYGVTRVHGKSPAFWFQDWFTPKKIIQFEGAAFEFYDYIFDCLEELDC